VTYTRGRDLSGSLAGAGGIGGLLAHSHGYSGGNWSSHHAYHADGSGNVTALADSAGALQASYRYDPYGRYLAGGGPLAGANVLRFSSKPWVGFAGSATSGLYYYGYRFYDAYLQRWLNRDPIEEYGGLNLYQFALNSPIMGHDPLGLKSRYADCMLGFLGAGDLVGECLNKSGCMTKEDCEKCMDWADKACRLYADKDKYNSCAGKSDCCKDEKRAIEDIKRKIQSGQATWSDLDAAYKALEDCLKKNSGPDGKPDFRPGDEKILPEAKKKCSKFK
jgi:RHS repeat-associated protein